MGINIVPGFGGKMERIVTKPLKVDLHIHSYFSKYKDEFDIVKDGTEDNLPLLFSKLCEYEVNVAAITDHDYFSFSLYQSFKKFEGHGTLLKVFPGVEFSVGIKGDDNAVKCVHVIAIFDDSNIDKVKRIESVLELKNGKINYENGINLYFTEEKFISKLRDINLDVVLIAHQKGSVTAKKSSKNDLKSLGDKTFDEFLQSSVFEALEFKSMRNGLFNNLFAKEKNASYDVVRFITGSDCHTWSCYPKHDLKLSEDGFHHTFLKCLPTFKGLCMALTDYTRISLSNSLFSNDDSALDKIELEENGKRFSIPLSKGLNAIIGDNSIGKSLLIHKLTAYSELSDNKIKDGYERYLEKNSLQILNSVEKDDIYHFDGQGAIRKRFESKDEKENLSFLQNKFPEPPLPDAYKSIINEQFCKIFEAIEAKFLFDSKLKQLKTLAMVNVDVKRKNIAASTLLYKKSKYDGYTRLKKYFEGIITKIGCPDSKVNDGLEQVDLVTLNHIKSELELLKHKYTKCLDEEKRVFNIKTGIKNGVDNYNSEIKLYKDSLEEKNDCFASDSEEMAQIISELVLLKRKIKKEDFTITEPIKVESAELIYGDYKFVRRFRNVNLISNEYLCSVLKEC